MSSIDYSHAEGDEYHRARHPEMIGNQPLIRAWAHYAHAVYFSFLSPGASVLEIGAGLGNNLTHLLQNHKVWAVEPSPLAREHCGSLGIPAYASVAELGNEARFDAILLRHMLEHVREPYQLLSEVKELLKPNGRLVVILPVESPFRKINPKDLDHHLYVWNPQSIHNLLRSCGYDGIEVKVNWYNGRRLFLPVYQWAGVKAYQSVLAVLGRLRGRSELIITATRGRN